MTFIKISEELELHPRDWGWEVIDHRGNDPAPVHGLTNREASVLGRVLQALPERRSEDLTNTQLSALQRVATSAISDWDTP